MTKKSPWEGGPNATIEEEWDHYNNLYHKKFKKNEKIKKQVEENGFYYMNDDDDIIEVLETLLNLNNK